MLQQGKRMDFAALAAQYRRELTGNILPFWLKHSADPLLGGLFSCFDRAGTVFDERKYVWMMARQVWMLSKLHNELEPNAAWLASARAGMEFLEAHALNERGEVYFSLQRDGRPAFFQRKPYAAVFLALAWHEYGRAVDDRARQQKASEMFARIRAWIARPADLGRPLYGEGPPMSQLADIYVTAFLASELEQPEWLDALWPQLDQHFDTARGTCRENAGVADSPEARQFCAGSVFEVGWILLPHASPARQQQILAAMAGAHELGWDREHGGYYYFQDLDGRPPLALEANMKLWWVHVEALNAFAHAYELTRDPAWLARFQQAHGYTWAHFPDPAYGEWFGYLDRRGEPVNHMKGGPYKCCFHIPRALWLCSRIFNKLAN